MRIEPPVKVSAQQMTIDVQEIEALLQAPSMNLPPWPEASLTLRDGRTLYLRSATEDDAP